MRIRSPGYPSINLREAIDLASRIFTVSRQSAIDREAAAKDIGYNGLTGQSAKMLANLSHFDLIEKAGKGGLRVTDTAVKILHPRNLGEKKAALINAAYSPGLFQDIKENWPDGFVPENALRGHLLRNGFSSGAVAPAISSYMETYGFLQQEGATESHGLARSPGQNATREGTDMGPSSSESRAMAVASEVPQQPVSQVESRNEGPKLMDGERIVFVEESGPAQYLKVVASGDLDETLLEALEDYIKRQKKRLGAVKPPSVS